MVLTGLLTTGVTNLYLLLLLRVAIAAAAYFAVMKLLRVKIMDECLKFIFRR